MGYKEDAKLKIRKQSPYVSPTNVIKQKTCEQGTLRTKNFISIKENESEEDYDSEADDVIGEID